MIDNYLYQLTKLPILLYISSFLFLYIPKKVIVTTSVFHIHRDTKTQKIKAVINILSLRISYIIMKYLFSLFIK